MQVAATVSEVAFDESVSYFSQQLQMELFEDVLRRIVFEQTRQAQAEEEMRLVEQVNTSLVEKIRQLTELDIEINNKLAISAKLAVQIEKQV